MKDLSIDNKDILHHLLEEQIAIICVKEEEEQFRKELEKPLLSTESEGY